MNRKFKEKNNIYLELKLFVCSIINVYTSNEFFLNKSFLKKLAIEM